MKRKFFAKLIFIVIASILLVSFGAFASNVYAANGHKEKKWEGNYSDVTFIVKYKSDTSLLVKARTTVKSKAELDKVIGGDINTLVLRVPEGSTVEEMLNMFVEDSNVEYVEPDYLGEFYLIPTDPNYNSQKGVFDAIKAPQAWDYTTGSDDIIIAVVDSGCNYNHVDLGARIILGWDFVNGKIIDATDPVGHGTGVCGVNGAITNNRNRNSSD